MTSNKALGVELVSEKHTELAAFRKIVNGQRLTWYMIDETNELERLAK